MIVTQLVLSHAKVVMEIVTVNAKTQIPKSVMNFNMMHAQMEVQYVTTTLLIIHAIKLNVKQILLENSQAYQTVQQLVQSLVLVVPEEAQVNAKVTKPSVTIISKTNAHQEVQYVMQESKNIHA